MTTTEMTPLAQLCTVFADGDWVESKDQSTEGIRLIQTGNVGIGVFKDRAEKARYISEQTFYKLNCTEIFEGDCLVSRLPDPAGRSCIIPHVEDRLITAVDCTIIRFKADRIIPRYFNYYTQTTQYLNDVERESTGTTRKRISRSKLGGMLVPTPALSVQHRIVRILDEDFEKIAIAKANAEKNLKNAREVFESYLNRVFEIGGSNWVGNSLESLTTKIGSGATPRGGEESYKSEGVSLIRSMNVHDYGFKYRNLAFLDEDQAENLSNVELRNDDVLLNITGASVARCCVVPADVLPARVNQHVSILRPKPSVLDSEFLHYLLISHHYKNQLLQTGAEGGSTRQAITKAQLQDVEISFPEKVEEQRLIVEQLDAVLSETQRLESIYTRKIAALDELKKSLLHQAFEGLL